MKTRPISAFAALLLAALIGAALPCPMPAQDEEGEGGAATLPPDLVEDEHFREEVGVNEFTVPSIRKILQDLKDFAPIPPEALGKALPKPDQLKNRVALALAFGGLVCDGFVQVQIEDKSQVEGIAKNLFRYVEAMAVGDRVKTHAKSLVEKAYDGSWDALRKELAETQRDVEYDMLVQRDEQLAHMVSLGGWIRAIETTSGIVKAQFTPEKAAKLVRIELLNYYEDRLTTLDPKLRKAAAIQVAVRNLAEIRKILEAGKAGLTVENVASIHDLAAAITAAIVQN